MRNENGIYFLIGFFIKKKVFPFPGFLSFLITRDQLKISGKSGEFCGKGSPLVSKGFPVLLLIF